ncbi:hypothetical protein Peur_015423 [Populus x canadensis]
MILLFHSSNPGSDGEREQTDTEVRIVVWERLVEIMLKTSKEIKNKDKNVSKKILLSNSAPPVVSEEISGGGGGGGGKKVLVKERSGALGFLKRLPRKVLAVLSILPVAIGEMFVIAVLMAPDFSSGISACITPSASLLS